jgi:uncharacterized RDD family membrane protein YckC
MSPVSLNGLLNGWAKVRPLWLQPAMAGARGQTVGKLAARHRIAMSGGLNDVVAIFPPKELL